MLTGARSRLAEARDGDAGATLMELLVAMAVAIILAVMAGYFFIGTSTSSTAATEQSLQGSQGRDALQQWTQLIRVASANQITSLATDSTTGTSTLTFAANLANRTGTAVATGGSTVTLVIDNTNDLLRQTITDVNGASTSTVLLGCTLSSANYCSSRGKVISGRFTPYYTATGCAAGNLTPAGLCTVDPAASPSPTDAVAIGITFAVDGVAGREHAATQTFSTLVSIGSAT